MSIPYEATVDTLKVGQKLTVKEKQYDVIKQIYNGVFSQVYMLRNKHGSLFAMKTEKQNGCERPVLKLDVRILRELNGRSGFPELVASGRTPSFKFVVMKFVGPDLHSLMIRMPQMMFTASTIYRVALQTLDRVENLHSCGWINRDIKPQNFAVGVDSCSGVVYMLDFGLARKITDSAGHQKAVRARGPHVGTMAYSPLASTVLQDQTKKDDLESWFYMMIEMLRGFLPWWHARFQSTRFQAHDWKLYARGPLRKYTIADLPGEWDRIFELILNTGPFEKPPYDVIRELVQNVVRRYNVDMNGPFDWQIEPALVEMVKKSVEVAVASAAPSCPVVERSADVEASTTTITVS